jgi:hypothetical protein
MQTAYLIYTLHQRDPHYLDVEIKENDIVVPYIQNYGREDLSVNWET